MIKKKRYEPCWYCKKRFLYREMLYSEFDVINPETGEEYEDAPFYFCSVDCIKKTCDAFSRENMEWYGSFKQAFPEIDFDSSNSNEVHQ